MTLLLWLGLTLAIVAVLLALGGATLLVFKVLGTFGP